MVFEETSFNKEGLLRALAKALKLKESEINVFFDFDKTPTVQNSETIKYIIKLMYKDVAFKQSANGLWTESILNLCTTKSIKELQTANSDIQLKSVDAWYTLVGLKLLTVEFMSEKLKWKLIANKARQ